MDKETNAANQYERFIKYLFNNVKKSGRDIRFLSCGKDNKWTGYSGQKHQIDVSFIDYSFKQPTLVLVECKRWKYTVDVSRPKILKYNRDDIVKKESHYSKNNLMIIVASSRFSSGAQRIAKNEGIITKVVNTEPPYGFSYANLIQLVHIDSFQTTEDINIEIIKS